MCHMGVLLHLNDSKYITVKEITAYLPLLCFSLIFSLALCQCVCAHVGVCVCVCACVGGWGGVCV